MDYNFEGNIFVLSDYNNKPTFSSLMPGVAGVKGVPLWCFYVNRGQCVAAFGADDRDHSIMEYTPAVVAYENTTRKGFRTFIKTNEICFEPFRPGDINQSQEMRVGFDSLDLSTKHSISGLNVNVSYRIMPGEDTGALIRKLTIRNSSAKSIKLCVADGMARLIPSGINNTEFHEMANLLKSYTEAKQNPNGFALYSSRSTTENSAQVGVIRRRHFYYSSLNGKPLSIVCDPSAMFGYDTGYDSPLPFYRDAESVIKEGASGGDKIPCAFAIAEMELKGGEDATIYSFAGFFDRAGEEKFAARFSDLAWCESKFEQSRKLTEKLFAGISSETSRPLFDAYIHQCLLDNAIRGGFPERLGTKLLHVYGRRHGDLERDYNFFRIQATHYSQGDGNFRDVCQNRRNDVLICPETGKTEAVEFLNYIQLDGYNKLELHPTLLVLRDSNYSKAKELLQNSIQNTSACEQILSALQKGQSVGAVWKLLSDATDDNKLMESLIILCDEQSKTVFHDGYWIDHWTYIPDLVDSFLKVYPERADELLINTPLTWASITAEVRPLREKLTKTAAGMRQYNAVVLLDETDVHSYCLTATAFEKLFFLAAIKCATLDPMQMGIEMEAGKPGWNDALNGLPGLFGSSTSECVDLLLLIRRLKGWARHKSSITEDIFGFVNSLIALLNEHCYCKAPSLAFWKASLKLRENWRDKVYCNILSNKSVEVSQDRLLNMLSAMEQLIQNAISRARNEQGLLHTYFIYSPVSLNSKEILSEDDIDDFSCHPLPLFLEGQVKLLRIANADSRPIHEAVESSPLFDRQLSMYRLCAPLENESPELGRIHVFTPGVFERESIFLHAEYKYLISLLDAGLYEEMFARIQTVLVPFMKPELYGRSTLENSSYLVSSANPRKELVGKGFVSRLSGATAEFISIWIRMFLGNRLFTLNEKGLTFEICPILPGWLFPDDGTIRFTYLGCQFSYINPERKDIYPGGTVSIKSLVVDGKTVLNTSLSLTDAEKLRNQQLKSITAYLG